MYNVKVILLGSLRDMDKKNILNSKDPGNKKSNKSGWKNLTAGAVMLASVLSSNPWYSQDVKYSTDLQKKNTIELIEKNDTTSQDTIENDSLEHQKIITMSVDSIVSEYWQEKGMEIINEHMLIEINKIRKSVNNKPLVINDTLRQVAQDYAAYMDSTKNFSHNNLNLEKCDKRIEKKLWWKNFVFDIVWENIAAWQETIAKVMDHRVNHSLPHRRNMLFAFYTDVGIGYCDWYRVQNFGKKKKK